MSCDTESGRGSDGYNKRNWYSAERSPSRARGWRRNNIKWNKCRSEFLISSSTVRMRGSARLSAGAPRSLWAARGNRNNEASPHGHGHWITCPCGLDHFPLYYCCCYWYRSHLMVYPISAPTCILVLVKSLYNVRLLLTISAHGTRAHTYSYALIFIYT